MPSMSSGEVSWRTSSDLLAALRGGLGVLGGEIDAAAGGARRGRQTVGDRLGGVQRRRVKLRVQQRVQLLGFHLQNGLVFA